MKPVDSQRYTRQMVLPGVGLAGQQRLASAHVAIIGAGGLGAPVVQYLAAAGVGELTIIDGDRVDVTNLHRQVIHTEDRVGSFKVESAAASARAINSTVRVHPVATYLTDENALELLCAADVVVDGSDNVTARYLVDDACAILQMPLISGSIWQLNGQVAGFDGLVRYRDLYPEPNLDTPNCAEAGVLGPLCGVIGSAVAMAVLRLLLDIGDSPIGRLLTYNGLTDRWTSLSVKPQPGRMPVTELVPVDAAWCPAQHTGDAVPEITAAQLKTTVHAGEPYVIVDVREADEVAQAPLPQWLVASAAAVHHIPSGVIVAQHPHPPPASGKVIVLCHSGIRSHHVTARWLNTGVRVVSLAGGVIGLGVDH